MTFPPSSLPSLAPRADDLAEVPPPSGWRGALRALSLARVGWSVGLAAAVAALLNPIFTPPFAVVFGRAVFVALVLLLAFTLAGQWRQQRVPRWLMQVLAVMLAAPVATLAVYLMSTGGDFKAIVDNPYRIAGFIWISGSALLVGLILALGSQVRERDATARALELQLELQRSRQARQALDARLALLTAQVEPHFLFNTLANVQALVETGSPRAPEVLRSLIAYLRAALPRLHGDGGLPPLSNEVGLVRAYLELMHLRMPDRLQFRVDVPAGLQARRFPSMALLTLVENAVRHGIDPAEQGGRIEVGGLETPDGRMRLWVQDSGVGMSPQAQPGTGLVNLRERLQGLHADAATLEFSALEPHGVRAEIVLPG